MDSVVEITCVGDFLKVIKKFSPQGKSVFYRGQRNSNYGINSSLSRLLKKVSLKPLNISRYNFITSKVESNNLAQYALANKLYSTFKQRHILYPDVNIINGYNMNDIDLHVTAQHYGLATRVIDLTYSPLVALYFATEKKKDDKSELGDEIGCKDAAVFMMWNSNDANVDVCTSDNFIKRIEAERKIYSEIYDACNVFYLSNHEKYKSQPLSADFDLMVQEFCRKIFKLQGEWKPGRFIKLNPHFHLIDLMSMSQFLKKDELSDFTSTFFSSMELFLSTMGYNYDRESNCIDMHNDYITIIEPLPINQRVKNQQGVLMFCNNIMDEVYPAAHFDDKNTVECIDNISLSKIKPDSGLLKILIPGESIEGIRNELEVYGFTKDFIYPEIMSFTEYLQDKIVASLSI